LKIQVLISTYIQNKEGANKFMKAIQCLSGMLEFIASSTEKKKMFLNLAGINLIFDFHKLFNTIKLCFI